jgi:hypothetical protein
MPNWCNNTLEITHSDPAMIERARVAFKEGRLLEEFCPVPESLHIVAGCVGDPDEQKKLEEDTARNLEVHGYGNWYDYCVNEWGTKWDVGGDDYNAPQDIPNGLIMTFDSAWAPPCAAYEKMMDLGFSIRATYYEPGMCFAGIWEDGNDDFYEIGGMSANEVEDLLPEFLDESYGISECIREYEEEEEDEELHTWVVEGAEAKKANNE